MQEYDDLPKTVVKPSNQRTEDLTPLPPTAEMPAQVALSNVANADLEFHCKEATGGPRPADARHPSVETHRKHGANPRTACEAPPAAAALPEIGTVFLGFRLVAVLGEGAFGRVYLAEQGDLANRPVALKVATNIVGEAHTLAQLQHTHIVPIYSVHRATPFQAVCMPYFGATTLADVLQEVRRTASLPASGKIFVS
ncbi:MAG TPA: protein kinase, partial [Gemmataceae bacterium]